MERSRAGSERSRPFLALFGGEWSSVTPMGFPVHRLERGEDYCWGVAYVASTSQHDWSLHRNRSTVYVLQIACPSSLWLSLTASSVHWISPD